VAKKIGNCKKYYYRKMTEKGFVQKDLEIRVSLAPYYLSSPKKGIKHFLNNNLFRLVLETCLVLIVIKIFRRIGGYFIKLLEFETRK
jgi:hypothetical protein